jgi:thiol-disulfide isomerase/thioredoxin
MKVFLLILVVCTHLQAQSYEQTLSRCIKSFQDGLSNFPRESAEEEIQRRYNVLSECVKGQKFPAFSLVNHKGSRISNKDLMGKVVIINFWFSKSPTSVAAIPMLNELVEEYKDNDFLIVSFSADGFASLSHFLKEHPVNYTIFEKSRDLINPQFSTVLGYPTNIFLNKKGEVVEYRVGGSIKPEELAKMKEAYKRIIDTELSY